MIRITKEGFKSYDWNRDTKADEEIPFNPIRHLRDAVESIAEDVTVGDIVEFVHKNEFLSVFMSEYSSCPVGEFYDALQSCAKGPTTLHYAEVALHCTVTHMKASKRFPEARTSVEYGWSLHGVGPLDQDDEVGRKKGEIINNWSISELSVEQLAVLPIRINKVGSLGMYDYPPGTDGHTEDTFDDVWITLLEFLDTILYDISFNGGPKDREKFVENLMEMVEEVKNGTAKTVPFVFEEKD